MSTGAKVVAWLENYKDRDVIFHFNGPKGVYGYGNGHKTGPHSGDPLILQSDHLAEVLAAREEGRIRGIEEAARSLEAKHLDTDYRGHHSAFLSGFEAAMDVVDALIFALGYEVPKEEG